MKKEAFLYSKLVFPVLRLHASAETMTYHPFGTVSLHSIYNNHMGIRDNSIVLTKQSAKLNMNNLYGLDKQSIRNIICSHFSKLPLLQCYYNAEIIISGK